MIVSKSMHTPPSVFTPGQRVAYITGGGRSYRLATVVSSNGKQTRVTIRLDSAGSEPKLMRVQPWNLRAEADEGSILRSSELRQELEAPNA